MLDLLAPDPLMEPFFLKPNASSPRHHAIVWLAGLNQPSFEAVRYACSIADKVTAVMVVAYSKDADRIVLEWNRFAGSETGALEFQWLESPFSSLLQPFCDFVVEQEQNHPELCTTVVMPVVVPRDRLDQTLLNQRALNLFAALSAGKSRVFSIVRYYMPPAGKGGADALAAWADVVVEPDHA